MKTLPDIRLFVILSLLAFLAGIEQVFAQTSCAEKLELAQNLYNEGKIHLIEETISDCLQDGFNKEEKIEAYKLLSITYTYLEEGEKAEEAVLNLLKFDKEYQVNPDLDPTEFIKLYDKFRTYPILKVGLKAVGNTNFFNVSRTRIISPNPEDNAGVIRPQVGFGGGIDVEIPYEDYLEFVPGLYFVYRSFSYTYQINSSNIETFEELATNTHVENQSWIELPILVRYKYMRTAIHPYAEAGFSLGYLVTNEKNTLETRTQSGTTDGPGLDFMQSRNKFNYALSAGAGLKFDIPMAELVIGGRFNFSLNDLTVVNSDPTPEETDLLYQYGVIESTYKMHTFSFFIGYMRKIYKPKKIYD